MEKRKAVVIAAVVAAATIGAAVVLTPVQAAELSGKLAIAGSTTVLPINQDCARIFVDMNPALRISISGGGSGHGVRAVGEGVIDIGAASRDIKTEEMARYPDLNPVVIGMDSVAVVVHPGNPVSEVTMEQVSKIFSGEIRNWKDVGGKDAEIRVITRDEGSGTREVFEENVMKPWGKELAREASVKPSNGEVRATVAGDEKSIAYLSLGYVDPTLKALMIDGAKATVDNVLSGDYAISRNLYLITKGAPEPLENAFIAFVLSEEGQEVVEDMGYIKMVVDDAPSPTPEAMPEGAPAPEETPTTSGFEALFAIACVLASVYAMWRRRK